MRGQQQVTVDPAGFAADLASEIAPRAAGYDRRNEFAAESLALLQRSGYAALTVPVEYGGYGVGLLGLTRAQERLAMADGAVALSIGMSLIQLLRQAVGRTWPEPLYERVMRDVGARGALVNSIATEPKLGSPSRGGKPETVAEPAPDGGWWISGHKTWASLAPILDYIIVTATILDGSGAVGRFMVERGEGVRVVETWDSMGMRATGSHDMIFERAYVPAGNLLGRDGGDEVGSPAPRDGVRPQNPYFSIATAGVYLGVAVAAHRAAVDYARDRVPLALGHPLVELPTIREALGEGERELRIARLALHDVARRVDATGPALDDELQLDVYVAKHEATNNAIAVVDRAMRIVGGEALGRGSVIERAYRDVRAGLLHPPADDVTRRVLGAWTTDPARDEDATEGSPP